MFWMDTDVYGAKLPLEIFPRAEDHTIFVLYNFLEYSMKYKILEIKKAETVGFEPTCPGGQLDFESSSLRPLRYVSIFLQHLFYTIF